METGKLKKVTYMFVFAMLLASVSLACMPTSKPSTEGSAKPNTATTVNLHTSFVNNGVQLSWQATSQANVRRYELEKSSDGENFFYITSFTGSDKKYVTEDKNLFVAVTYYRLKIVEADGTVIYSSTESFNTKTNTEAIRIMPTRLNANKLHIWVPANTSISCASVSGTDGKLQRKAVMNEGANIAIVDISGLTAGVYHLTVQTNKGETLKLKFTKS